MRGDGDEHVEALKAEFESNIESLGEKVERIGKCCDDFSSKYGGVYGAVDVWNFDSYKGLLAVPPKGDAFKEWFRKVESAVSQFPLHEQSTNRVNATMEWATTEQKKALEKIMASAPKINEKLNKTSHIAAVCVMASAINKVEAELNAKDYIESQLKFCRNVLKVDDQTLGSKIDEKIKGIRANSAGATVNSAGAKGDVQGTGMAKESAPSKSKAVLPVGKKIVKNV